MFPLPRQLPWTLLAVAGTGGLACGGIVEDSRAVDGTSDDGDGSSNGSPGPGNGSDGGANAPGLGSDGPWSPGGSDSPGSPGSPGSTPPLAACICSADGTSSGEGIVLENASGEFVFDEPPDPAIYPELDLACAPTGATYLPEHCERRASVSACSSEHGCLRLAPATPSADAQLTWFKQGGTSVLQIRGPESTVTVDQVGGAFSGTFAFVEDGEVMQQGKFSGCTLEAFTCN